MFTRTDRPRVAHVKAGFYGADGSGKTRTAGELAVGIHKLTRSQKGILFIDTESGSDFLVERVQSEGIAVYQDKTRAFSALVEDLDAAHKVADIVVVDSVTHFFRELTAAHLRSKNKKLLDLSDWGPIKAEWARFVERFLTLPLHIIICGRLGNVYEEYYDEDREKYSTAKTGTRMAGDGETGYEPNITFEMSKKYRKKGGTFDLQATCTKDRFDEIMARVFTFKTGEKPATVHAAVMKAFGPHLARYSFGADPTPVDVRASSEAMLAPEGPSYSATQRRRQIAVEEIDGLMGRYLPGSTARERQLRLEVRVAVFGTSSETRIAGLPPERLERGRKLVSALLDRIATDETALPADAKQFLPALAKLVNEIEDDPSGTDFALERATDDADTRLVS